MSSIHPWHELAIPQPSSLLTIRQQKLNVEDATRIAASGFIQDYNPSLENDVRHHLGVGAIYTVYEDRSKIGFVIYEFVGDILYISGIVLLPQAQGKGYGKRIISRLCEDIGVPFLGLRTQSPRMWSVGQKVCKQWYPNPNNEEPSPYTMERIKLLCECTKTPAYPVSKGFYGHPLYGRKPTVRDTNVQRWWDKMCSYENGDAVTCFGTL